MTSNYGTLRVLAVGMVDSVHFARWLQLFRNEKIEFHVFASGPNRRVHPLLEELSSRAGNANIASYHLDPIQVKLSLPVWFLDKFLNHKLRSLWLRRQINSIKPGFIHALELQNAGYTALRAVEGITPRPNLIVTNYGSDIYWFSRFPKHLEKIRKLLGTADRYSAECHRDVALAKELGFKGTLMPVIPNAGGFSDKVLSAKLESGAARNLILVKGYQGWVGRAEIAIEALKNISNQLSGLEVVFYSSNRKTVRSAKRFARNTGVKATIYKKNRLTHAEMLALFSQAKVYVGLSLSDGISTSLLEAMAMGAIPVQTSTACCDEWFTHTGVAVQDLSPEVVADAILRGLELSNDHGNRTINRETIRAKASEESVINAALKFYR